MNVIVKDYIVGDTAVSYDDGKRCLESVLDGINKGDRVTIDFSGIDYVITAFLNPIIGDLILQKGIDVMKSIDIINANPRTIEKIRLVKEGALIKREDME